MGPNGPPPTSPEGGWAPPEGEAAVKTPLAPADSSLSPPLVEADRSGDGSPLEPVGMLELGPDDKGDPEEPVDGDPELDG